MYLAYFVPNGADPSGMLAVCCRPMEVFKILGINQIIYHCQLRNVCLPDRETSYPVFPSSNPHRKLPNGCPCSSATSADISQCLAQIPQNDQPHGAPPARNNNCQSNVVDRLAKCCLSSTWRPQAPVASPFGSCIKGKWIVDGMGVAFYVCEEYEYSSNDWRATSGQEDEIGGPWVPPSDDTSHSGWPKTDPSSLPIFDPAGNQCKFFP